MSSKKKTTRAAAPEPASAPAPTTVVYRRREDAPYPGRFITVNVANTTVTLKEHEPTSVDPQVGQALIDLTSDLYVIERA